MLSILSEENEPITISGDGENIIIPRSIDTGNIYSVENGWIKFTGEDSDKVLELFGVYSESEIKFICVSKIVDLLCKEGRLDYSDKDTRFIIYEITLDPTDKKIYISIEELDKLGELEFISDDNKSIISNLVNYERKRTKKTKR